MIVGIYITLIFRLYPLICQVFIFLIHKYAILLINITISYNVILIMNTFKH